MSKKNKNEEVMQDKVMTKYDRKMQERKEKEAKAKKENLISKIITTVVIVVLVAAVAISIVVTVKNKNEVLKTVYLTVGEHEISTVEYDYYYRIMMTDYLNTYSAFLPYMGFDTSESPDLQPFDEIRSWGDVFDEMAVEQIKETKALVDLAKSEGFVYETEDEDYKAFVDGFRSQAEANELTLEEYYVLSFGNDATQSRIEPFVRETLYAGAYSNKLAEEFAPTEEEVIAYYEENKKNYDTMTYRFYEFVDLLGDAGDKANAMKDAAMAGEDFQALCDKYSNGEAAESTNTGASYGLIPSLYADWLYDEVRVAGETEVFYDEENEKYYVVQFVERVNEEGTNDKIASQIASEKVAEYKAQLAKDYEVKDVAGELTYLTNSFYTED